MFTQLRPILYVDDLPAEVSFYEKLGFTISYQEEGFVALTAGEAVLFGLQVRAGARYDPNPGLDQPLIWQMAVHQMEPVYQICLREQIPIQTAPAFQSWGEWTMTVVSPNGYRLTFESEQS